MAAVLVAVWLQDFKSPFYIADRAGVGGRPFRMVKVRSMIVRADQSGVESTSASDPRITRVGHFVRRWKIDELSQLWNVLLGDMSLVGPRPNTLREVEQYRSAERDLLLVQPGITDISSIVFSDEGDILRTSSDPDKAYSELIWPWKSRLGLFYIQNMSVRLDLQLICLTGLAIFNREAALSRLVRLLRQLGCDSQLCAIASRKIPLQDVMQPVEQQ
ncbi:sugar transferase [Tsuneonella flava]|nr:sugar transferase [Tsuneonella flava]